MRPYNSAMSDTVVFTVMICLLTTLCAFPLFRAITQTSEKEPKPLVLRIDDRDYSILLSALFGKVNREVPESAEIYIRNVDEYRVRIARQIEQNNTFITVLYTLTESLPKRLADGYQEEIHTISEQTKEHKIAILPYVENDAFLSTAVVSEYDLYPSFVSGLIERVNNNNTLRKLNEIREESTEIRTEIAVLYTKIKNVTNGR